MTTFLKRKASSTSHAKRPHVVIIGGGFAGLNAAKVLANRPVRVTLLDRRNHHLFQPLLYQVATAALATGEIAVPIRAVLKRYKNVQVFLAEVTSIDIQTKTVTLADGEMQYDYLILAAGAQTTYFGNDDWERDAPGLKSIEDAMEIRRRILCSYEAAERLPNDHPERNELLTFVVVGGGPTGVEMAGAIAEIATQTLKHDFRSINPSDTRVVLIQSGDHILPDYDVDLSISARKQLEHLGVEVKTGGRVTDIDPSQVTVGNEVIRARTIIWTAGVTASPLAKTLNVPLDRGGRVHVEPDMTVPGYPEVYVAGDLSSFTHTKNGEPLPGLAPVAIQEGKHAARNIMRTIHGRPRKAYRYFNKGSMATIGRARAVADFGKIHISGFFAWLSWLLIHVYFLIGFYNRTLVLFRWMWSYFTANRGARVITGHMCSAPVVRTPDVADSPSKTEAPAIVPSSPAAVTAKAQEGMSGGSAQSTAQSTLAPSSLNGAAPA
jgi:NADH dehydrogenase